MFSISSKGDYGLLLLSALAEKARAGREFVSLTEIAKEKNLSLPYLSQIVMPLKDAGILKSKEGREGGYMLSRDPAKINFLEVLEILEGPVAPVRCCSNEKAKCGCESQCGVKSTWQGAQKKLIEFLKNKTLADTLPQA